MLVNLLGMMVYGERIFFISISIIVKRSNHFGTIIDNFDVV